MHTFIRNCMEKRVLRSWHFLSCQEIPCFYWTWRFNTVFTRDCHWTLSSANWIPSIPWHSMPWTLLLVLPSHLHLGLPDGSSSPDVLLTKILCGFLISPFLLHTVPITFSLINFPGDLREEYKLWSSTHAFSAWWQYKKICFHKTQKVG